MEEYNKIKKINRYSNLVGCFKRFQSGKLELFLIVLEIIIIILCTMNILIVPHKDLNLNPIYGLRIAIMCFFVLAFIIVCFNKICRNKKKLNSGYFFCIGFFGSIASLSLVPINFLFVLISAIITQSKIKNNEGNKKYDSSSILAIDIFTLLILIAIFFFWYVELIFVYLRVKPEETIKEFVEAKKKYFESQSEKVVNIDISEKFEENHKKKVKNNKKEENNNDFDDITSTNKVNENDDKKSNQTKDDNISNKEDDVSEDK
jgi:hypothetical protein